MKKVNKKTLYVSLIVIAAAIAITVTVLFSSIAYAWLTNYVRGNFEFQAGEPLPFTLEIAKIKVLDSETVYTEANREYFDSVVNSVTKENNLIEAQPTGAKLEATLANMSFGRIDNVAQLKKENIVYLRLTVPKSLGSEVKINLHYGVDESGADNFIILCDSTGSAVTDTTILSNIQGLEEVGEGKAGDSFLLYDAVVSNNALDAAQIETELGSQFNDANYKRFVKKSVYDAANTNNPNTITIVNENYDKVDGDNYYVYIKVVPNLAVFAYSIDYISDIMPCYMYFRVSASFESGPTP